MDDDEQEGGGRFGCGNPPQEHRRQFNSYVFPPIDPRNFLVPVMASPQYYAPVPTSSYDTRIQSYNVHNNVLQYSFPGLSYNFPPIDHYAGAPIFMPSLPSIYYHSALQQSSFLNAAPPNPPPVAPPPVISPPVITAAAASSNQRISRRHALTPPSSPRSPFVRAVRRRVKPGNPDDPRTRNTKPPGSPRTEAARIKNSAAVRRWRERNEDREKEMEKLRQKKLRDNEERYERVMMDMVKRIGEGDIRFLPSYIGNIEDIGSEYVCKGKDHVADHEGWKDLGKGVASRGMRISTMLLRTSISLRTAKKVAKNPARNAAGKAYRSNKKSTMTPHPLGEPAISRGSTITTDTPSHGIQATAGLNLPSEVVTHTPVSRRTRSSNRFSQHTDSEGSKGATKYFSPSPSSG